MCCQLVVWHSCNSTDCPAVHNWLILAYFWTEFREDGVTWPISIRRFKPPEWLMDTIDRECLPGARTCALSTRVQQCQQGALAGSGPMVTKSRHRTPPISSTFHIVSPSECFRPFRQGAGCTSIKAPVTGFLFLPDFQYPNILCNAVWELYNNYEGLNREYHTPPFILLGPWASKSLLCQTPQPLSAPKYMEKLLVWAQGLSTSKHFEGIWNLEGRNPILSSC